VGGFCWSRLRCSTVALVRGWVASTAVPWLLVVGRVVLPVLCFGSTIRRGLDGAYTQVIVVHFVRLHLKRLLFKKAFTPSATPAGLGLLAQMSGSKSNLSIR
jgi:hypothetical protein